MLVTGGAGFIGSNFVCETIRESTNFEISVVDALTYAGNYENLISVINSIEFIQGNICDQRLIDDLVEKVDVVVHFAAESHVDNSIQDASPFVQTNIIGTYNILQAVRKYSKKLHHISTDEVFGDLPIESKERFVENSPYRPSSPYAATKASSDHLVRAWVRSYGIHATISNCANNYGPYQHIEKFIPRQITNLLTGKNAFVYGDGSNIREWTHVSDHNTAVRLIVERGRTGETYLIGSGHELSNRAVTEAIVSLMDLPPNRIDYVGDRPGHDLKYSNDSTKIREELLWSPEHNDFNSGLLNTIQWYRDNYHWWNADKDDVENRYGLV